MQVTGNINMQKMQMVLLGDDPKQVALLCPVQNMDFTQLENVPCTMLCRWWTYIKLSGLHIVEVCDYFGFSAQFLQDIQRVDRLFGLQQSLDETSLKIKLARLSDKQYQNYKEIIGAFSVLDTRFEKEKQMLEKIIQQNHAHRLNQLAINERFLQVNGFSRFKTKKIMPMLLKTVIEQPQTNSPSTLLALAKGFENIMGFL